MHIKIKSALPPLPKTQNTLPLKRKFYFMGMRFSCSKNANFQRTTKLAQPFPAPESRAKYFTGRGFFWDYFTQNYRFRFQKVVITIICLSVTVSVSKIWIARKTRIISFSKIAVSVSREVSVRINFEKLLFPFPRNCFGIDHACQNHYVHEFLFSN